MNIDTQKIADFLATHRLASGLGTAEEPCSIAAINLALSGRLTDDIPACMSTVIGKWIIGVQDRMPDGLRNSPTWKALLPLAAGTGRDPALEQRRAALLLDWLWDDVLPQLQPLADANGFGNEWGAMLADQTATAAAAAEAARGAAADSADSAADSAAWAAAWAAEWAARAAARAAAAEWAAAEWAAAAERAAAARASAAAADSAAAAATAATDDFWCRADPVDMLRRLVECC